jgi:hypothetical protein
MSKLPEIPSAERDEKSPCVMEIDLGPLNAQMIQQMERSVWLRRWLGNKFDSPESLDDW